MLNTDNKSQMDRNGTDNNDGLETVLMLEKDSFKR